jgi:UDP-2,3-diacylglucosamine pyrophosphatase LpxH
VKFYISDLHMGDRSKREDFKYDKELISFIEYIKSECGELILVGDTFDMWQCKLRDIVKEHNDSIEELVSINSLFIIGNHDSELNLLIPILKMEVADEVVDEGTLIIHGHIFDKFNNPKSKVGITITKLAGALETISPDIDLIGKVWRNNKSYYKSLSKLAIELNCKRAIFGHTHREEIVNYNGIQIANTGSWAEKKMPYIKENNGALILNYWKQ